ncbi:CPBP family intramembrane metalloprotease [Parabacteroides sp. 52]|uniref:CPBP family intramembrane glutamic endopeptidase n=1 Tax=unclassified Parabacteroides TaxID=2649774 RepID=UPI0013D366D7|nr:MULTISPECIES: CPBP family intramembrane glutamic endopeptidase [unclassified Parabacteroides]MDH6534276.1 membrane protease YdiL (CAAX protease family) [Parabacteroides sp. PM5-20]NDV55340.1 CPBP family intramembrane metalloprotease [Parabacteroides sp. 52]
MNLKGILADRPGLQQLFVLLLLVFGGYVVSSFLGYLLLLVLHGAKADLFQYPDTVRWLQLISSIGTFLLPAWGTAWLCSLHPREFLSIGKMPGCKILFLAFIGLLLITPSISLTEFLNRQLELPASLKSIEDWMRTQENTAKELTDLLLRDKNLSSYFFNLLVIAVMAGITEEFLFRGALQSIMGRFTPNHHIVIWGTALLFSIFHMQFYGLIPRMLLGAYFGYIVYWSRNIWIPILLHFINNAVVMTTMSSERLKEKDFMTGDFSENQLLPLFLFALAGILFFIPLIRRLKKNGCNP